MISIGAKARGSMKLERPWGNDGGGRSGKGAEQSEWAENRKT